MLQSSTPKPSELACDYAIVVLAYGDSPFLEMCLQTLKAQTLAPSELWVSTSTPSPYIEDIARRYQAKLVVNPMRGGGIAADWNFGLTASQARFVTLAHQDDTYFPTFCEETMAAFARTPQASLCFTSYKEVDDAGLRTHSKISFFKGLIETFTLARARVVKGMQMRAYLAFGQPLPCSSVTFDRRKLPDFTFSSEMKATLDWKAWLDLVDTGAVFARSPNRLVGRRHNELTETSKLIKSGDRATEDLIMFKRIWPAPIARAIAWLYRAGY